MITFAHPVDEPCPPGCPTRLDEIAEYVSGHLAAYAMDDLRLTGTDITAALCTPREARSEVQRLIVLTEEGWN